MNSFLNVEIGSMRYADLLREAANERLARSVRPEREPKRRFARLRGLLGSRGLRPAHLPS